jgi:ABC-type nitrate/sulfonate/bicarbonate transport system permease component
MLNPHQPLSSRARISLGVAGAASAITIWGVLAGFDIVSQASLPSPWEVLQAGAELAWDGTESRLLEASAASCSRVLLAALLVVSSGVPLGILMGVSPRVNAFLSPLLDPFRSAPVVVVLPVLVMWLGIDELMKIVFLWMGATVYLVPMVRDAVLAVPENYYVKLDDLGATPWETVRHAVIPAAGPRIADAIIVAVSIEWTYITVAEYVNAKVGLGKLIQEAKRFSAMDQVFAGILVITFLALISYVGMRKIKESIYSWESV